MSAERVGGTSPAGFRQLWLHLPLPPRPSALGSPPWEGLMEGMTQVPGLLPGAWK